MTEEEIREWIRGEPESKLLDYQGVAHIAMCMKHILDWYENGHALGSFLTAVVKNNLMEACGTADDTNRPNLSLYTKFLYNNVPLDYKKKAKELR